MSKPLLTPQGDFPPVGLGRRLAAMFYDFLLCTALLIVTAGAYKMIQMSIIGEARMRELTEAGALDGDPLLSTVLLFALFGFLPSSGPTVGRRWVCRYGAFGCRMPMARPSACGRRSCGSSCRLPRGCAWGWVFLGADRQAQAWLA